MLWRSGVLTGPAVRTRVACARPIAASRLSLQLQQGRAPRPAGRAAVGYARNPCSTAERRSEASREAPIVQRNAHAPPLRAQSAQALTLCVALRRRMRCLAFLATAKMASCLFPPNLSDGPTNLPLAEDIEKNPTVFGELLRGEAPIRKLHECDASGPGVLGAPAYAIDATVPRRDRACSMACHAGTGSRVVGVCSRNRKRGQK